MYFDNIMSVTCVLCWYSRNVTFAV